MAEEGETDNKVQPKAYNEYPGLEWLSSANYSMREHLMKPFEARPDLFPFMPRPNPTHRDEDCDVPKDKVGEYNLHERIDNIFRVLSVFELLGEKKLKRDDYVNQLVMDLSAYHHYDKFTVEAVVKMLGVTETEAYFCSLGKNLTTCILTNTLKTTREDLQLALSRKQIECKPIYEWSDVGFVVDASESHLSSTAEYADGHFTIQSASSFLPVLALDPQKHEGIADMWASGVEQTAYIAALKSNFNNIIEVPVI